MDDYYMGPELTKEGIVFDDIKIDVKQINDNTHITITTPVGYSIKKIGELGYDHHCNNTDDGSDVVKITSVEWWRAVPNNIYNSKKEKSFILESLFKHKEAIIREFEPIRLSGNDAKGGLDE